LPAVGFVTGTVVALHFAFLGYVLVGGYLAWRWPRTIWLHAVAGLWVVLIISGGPNCPLTYAEHWARRQAGEVGPFPGFIDRYVEGVFFPTGQEWVGQVALGIVVAVSWVGFALRRRSRRRHLAPAG
jgi:hypothetical protein